MHSEDAGFAGAVRELEVEVEAPKPKSTVPLCVCSFEKLTSLRVSLSLSLSRVVSAVILRKATYISESVL